MPVRSVRPAIRDLRFHCFARSVHPELFQTFAQTRLVLGGFEIFLNLTQSGHMVHVVRGGKSVTEIVTSKETLLPKQKHFLNESIRGSHHVDCQPADDWQFHVGLQIETLEPEIFYRVQNELVIDAQKADLVHKIDGEGRFETEAISFLSVENIGDALLVGAAHTFPEERAIVKTHSLLECR